MEATPRSAFYGQIRIGRISSVNKDKHTARVEFSEGDGWISFDFPVLGTVAGDYALPVKDTPVLCLIIDGAHGDGYVVGSIYTDKDPPPLDDAGKRSIVGDDLRLGDPEAEDKVALAPATKDEIQKVLDYAQGIATAIQGGVVVAQDGGANLKSTIVAALPTVPELEEPAAENVSAK